MKRMFFAQTGMPTTMMTTKRTLLAVFLSLVSIFSHSQKSDFGIYYGLESEIRLVKKLELDIEANVRTLENASRINQMYLEPGLTYKLNKYFSVGAGYRFSEFIQGDDKFHPRHRWFANIKGKASAGAFQISGRLRFQQTYRTYIKNESVRNPYENVRFKLKTLYKTPSFPVNPYLATELYTPLFQEHEKIFNRRKYIAGAEYKISKKHAIELEYMFQEDFSAADKKKTRNVISVNYSFKL